MKSHYQALDGLRGTAAFSVFLFHICEMLVVDLDHNPMPHTFLAVDFFFALSGFVLGHAYDESMSRSGTTSRKALSFGGFVRRRLIRLHPMVVMALIIAVAAYLLDPFVGGGPRVGVKLPWLSFAMTVLLSLFLLPSPGLPDTFGETHSINGPSWTLFQEYIANLLYGLFGRKLRLGLHCLLCVASALALVWTAWHFGDLGHGWGWSDFWVAPVRLACPFLIGLLISRQKLNLAVPYPFFLLSAVLLAVFFAPRMGRFNGLFEAGCVIIIFPAIVAGGTSVGEIKGWQGKLCRLVGELSYPLYMIHYPFIYLFAHWKWSMHPDPVRLSLVVAALCAGVAGLAYVLTRYYDRPVRAWLTRLGQERTTSGAPEIPPQAAVVPVPAVE
ncbi:MAG: acyltransferase [Sphingomonas sp.]|nr:acyltransferase [Sphingomonas sp.]